MELIRVGCFFWVEAQPSWLMCEPGCRAKNGGWTPDSCYLRLSIISWRYGFVWKCCVPHCTQWFCWSLSRFLNGYFIGNIPYFQTNPYSGILGHLHITNHMASGSEHVFCPRYGPWPDVLSRFGGRAVLLRAWLFPGNFPPLIQQSLN